MLVPDGAAWDLARSAWSDRVGKTLRETPGPLVSAIRRRELMPQPSWTESDLDTVLTTQNASNLEVARQLHRTPGSIAYVRLGIHHFHLASGGGSERMLAPKLKAHLEAGRGRQTCPSCGTAF
jgi:hypothetical protein